MNFRSRPKLFSRRNSCGQSQAFDPKIRRNRKVELEKCDFKASKILTITSKRGRKYWLITSKEVENIRPKTSDATRTKPSKILSSWTSALSKIIPLILCVGSLERFVFIVIGRKILENFWVSNYAGCHTYTERRWRYDFSSEWSRTGSINVFSGL